MFARLEEWARQIDPFLRPGFVRGLIVVSFCAIALLVLTDRATHIFPPQVGTRIMFSLEEEANIPTCFASMLWLLVAFYSFHCYRADLTSDAFKPTDRFWLLIMSAFLYCSIDEEAKIHERLPWIVSDLSQQLGFGPFALTGSWLLIYSPVLISFIVISGIFLWKKLAFAPTGRLFLGLIGLCYALAVGLEVLKTLPNGQQICTSTRFLKETRIIYLAQETLENLGTAFTLAAVAGYASAKFALLRSQQTAKNAYTEIIS